MKMIIKIKWLSKTRKIIIVFRIVLSLRQKVKVCPNLTSFQNEKYIRVMEVELSNICTLVSWTMFGQRFSIIAALICPNEGSEKKKAKDVTIDMTL